MKYFKWLTTFGIYFRVELADKNHNRIRYIEEYISLETRFRIFRTKIMIGIDLLGRLLKNRFEIEIISLPDISRMTITTVINILSIDFYTSEK